MGRVMCKAGTSPLMILIRTRKKKYTALNPTRESVVILTDKLLSTSATPACAGCSRLGCRKCLRLLIWFWRAQRASSEMSKCRSQGGGVLATIFICVCFSYRSSPPEFGGSLFCCFGGCSGLVTALQKFDAVGAPVHHLSSLASGLGRHIAARHRRPL